MQKLAYLLLSLFVFSIPWENTLVFNGIGTIAKVVGALAAGGGIAAVVWKGKVRLLQAPHLFMLAFVVFACASSLWSVDSELTTSQLVTYAQLFLMVSLLRQLVLGTQEHDRLLAAYVAGGYVSALGTFYTYLFRPEVVRYGRYVAQGFDPNELGLLLACGIPMAWHLFSKTDRSIARWALGLYIPTAMVAILMTASRGAFVATLASLCIIPITFRNISRRSKFLFYAGVIVAAYGAAVFVPDSSWSRLGTIGAELRSGTVEQRMEIWKAGMNVFPQYPVGGLGSGAYKAGVDNGLGVELVAHNVFVSVLVEQGIIGFMIFSALLLSLVSYVRRLAHDTRKLWSVLLLVWVVGGLTLTMEPRKLTWFIWGMIAAIAPAALAPKGAKAEAS